MSLKDIICKLCGRREECKTPVYNVPLYPERSERGGILTGVEIAGAVNRGEIKISDFDSKRLNPNSYNLRVGDTVRIYDEISTIDLHDPTTFSHTSTLKINQNGITLRPGNLYLISTQEVIATEYYVPFITGRSSIGRLGISIHSEAGLADIGYSGQLTHQIKVTYPTKLYAGDIISQVYFLTPVGALDIQYRGNYQNSVGPVQSRYKG